MKKEEAILALSELGCSKKEIAESIRIEQLRRKAIKEMQKKLDIAEIVKDMKL